MTTTVNMKFDADGPVIVEWTDWEPTPTLRWHQPNVRRILQQQKVRLGLTSAGSVGKREYLWVDVPTEA